MRKNIIIGVLALAAFAYWYLSKVNVVKKLTFSLGTPTKVNFATSFIEWTQNIRVINAESVGVTVNGVNLTNSINGSDLGSTVLFQPTKIQASSETLLPVVIRVPYIELAKFFGLNFIGLVAKVKGEGIKYNMRGNITAESISVNVNQDFLLKL